MDRCQLSNGQKQKTLWPRLLLVFISVRAKKNLPRQWLEHCIRAHALQSRGRGFEFRWELGCFSSYYPLSTMCPETGPS